MHAAVNAWYYAADLHDVWAEVQQMLMQQCTSNSLKVAILGGYNGA